MGIDHESPGPAGSGHARPTGDPLQMTEAEKRAAEWEARHDVAARGHRGEPAAVQHYLAEIRTRQASHPAAPTAAAGHTDGRTVEPVPRTDTAAGATEPVPPRPRLRRRWWPFGRRG